MRAYVEADATHGREADADPRAFAARFQMPSVAPGPTRAAPERAPAPGITVGPSSVHGEGAFADGPIGVGDVICRMILGNDVTFAASKVNCSPSNPNVRPVAVGSELVLRASRPIGPGEELLGNYPHPGR